MDVGRILKAGVAVGVVVNAWDFVMNTYVMPMLGRAPESVYLPEELMLERLVITNFIAAFVLVWFYDKVKTVFGTGAANGTKYGASVGILINFPMWLMIANLFRGYPYVDAGIWTAYGVVWGIIAGAVAGFVYEKTGPKPA